MKAKYEVLAPLVEQEADIEDINQALAQFVSEGTLTQKETDILLDI